MKTKIIAMAFLIIAACAVRAQTFSGPLTFTGTTNAPLWIGGLIPTNPAAFYVPQKSIITGNINTNETEIISYGAIIVGQGFSNYVAFNSITNTFPNTNYSNGGSITNSVPAQSLIIQVVPYAQVQITSPYTNTIIAP